MTVGGDFFSTSETKGTDQICFLRVSADPPGRWQVGLATGRTAGNHRRADFLFPKAFVTYCAKHSLIHCRLVATFGASEAGRSKVGTRKGGLQHNCAKGGLQHNCAVHRLVLRTGGLFHASTGPRISSERGRTQGAPGGREISHMHMATRRTK